MAGLLDIASSGIRAYREALAVTGQNIANIDTEGYRRRGAALSEIAASQSDITTIADQTGLGVRVESISRAFDSFISGRARDATSDFSQAEAYAVALETMEGALVPGDYDLGYFLGGFFDGLNGVAQAPGDLATRSVALTKGSALANGFVQLSQDLSDLRDTIWQETANVTRDVNSLLTTLRNTQSQLISSGSASGASNALLDARDQTISEIATLVGVTVSSAASGAATVTLGRSGNGPLLGSATQTGSLQVQQSGDRLVFLGGQLPGLAETQQVSSGRLAGLSEAYRAVNNAIHALDTLASRLATEFNAVHANGIDLNGKVGGALFTADGVAITQSATNLGSFTATATAPEVIDQTAAETRFSYSAARGAWLSFDATGKATTHARGPITIGAVRIDISGKPADGDEFTLNTEIGKAAQMRFLLEKPQEIAAAGLLLSQADITNTADTTLEAAAIAAQAATGLTDITKLLRDDLSTLSATALRQNGVLGVIPAGTSSVDLVSMGRQDSVSFSMTEAQTAAAGTFSITLNATGHSFNLTDFQDYISDQPGSDVGDLARMLNAGTLRTAAGTGFADLGLFAAGSGGSLTIASATNTGAITAASIDTLAGNVVTGSPNVSNLQVFTRDGRQIAGTALSQADIVGLLTEANGFLAEAEYRTDFLNGDGGVGYRGMEVVRRTTAGAEVLTISTDGTAPSLILGDGAAVSSTTVGTLALTIGSEREQIAIPAGISAGIIAERINAAMADTGIRAEASTRLALSQVPNGLVAFTLAAKNEAPIAISANVTDGSLENLASAINARRQDTGVVATLGTALDRLVLVSDSGDDLVLGAITSSGGSFTATPVSDTAAARGSAVTLASVNGNTALRLGGDITLSGSQSFSATWQGESADSRADAFSDGLIARQVDPAGRWQDLSFTLSEGLDTAEADPEGFAAIAAATRLSVAIAGTNDTSTLSAEIDSATLSHLDPAAVAQAMAAELRSLGTVPTLTGLAVITKPADGTTVQILLGSQSYGLTMVDGEIAVSGPEAGRITAFFDENNMLTVAATGGSLSGQILRLSSETASVDARAFGLSVTGASAGLTGRAVTAPVGATSFSIDAVIDGTNTTLTFPWGGSSPITSSGGEGVSLTFTTSGSQMVVQLLVPQSSGIADFRLRPSVDAHALGLVSADAEVILGPTGLRIASTGRDAVQLSATATSLVAERLTLGNLPGEDLIVIATGSGARRIAAAFGEAQTVTPTPAALEVRIVDGAARRVEIIDRNSGHSMATRIVEENGSFTAYGMRFDLNGVLETGDRFYVEANQNGTGDGRNAVALFALGDGELKTGLGGFAAEFSSLVTNTGADTRSATVAQSSAEARRDAAVELEAEYSGVNLDDEAARLLEQQQAYQALARVLRTASDLLDTLLNAIS